MFKKLSLIASLLFFLLGTNVLADSNYDTSTKSEKNISSQTVINKVTNKSIKAMQTTQMEIKKAEPTWKNYVVPASVCLFIIIISGGYWFIFRKRLFSK